MVLKSVFEFHIEIIARLLAISALALTRNRIRLRIPKKNGRRGVWNATNYCYAENKSILLTNKSSSSV